VSNFAGLNMNFEFATASRIIFGPGSLARVGSIVADLGQRALVVTGQDTARASKLVDQLQASDIHVHLFPVDGEPEIETVRMGVEVARQHHCQLVVSFGGGSAMDAAKAVSALATNPGDIYDYLEVVGKGISLTVQPLPCVAIPTTSGTGSEVTRNAVLWARAQTVKVSLRSAMMLPSLALVDPELTLDLPRELTARTGMDALSQLIEPYVSSRATPMTDAICCEGIRRVAASLRTACTDGSNLAARQDMSLASLFSGLALANAGLGAVHGFAAVIGGMYGAPHGSVCARLLPEVIEVNLRALSEREPASPAILRYRHVAQLLTGNQAASEQDGAVWVRELCKELDFPDLNQFGMQLEHIPEVVEKAQKASSMKPNPILLSFEELSEIMVRAL